MNNNGLNPVVRIRLASIRPSSVQPRLFIEDAHIGELASSIKEKGQFDPILVKKIPPEENDGFEYELLHGEGRFRATGKNREEEIEARILEIKDPIDQLLIPLTSQINTQELNWVEIALAIKKLDGWGLSADEIAKKIGKHPDWIKKHLKAASLSKEVLMFALPPTPEENRLSLGHALILLPLPAEKQAEFAKTFSENQLALKYAESLVEKIAAEQNIPLRTRAGKTGKSPAKRKKFSSLIGLTQKVDICLEALLDMEDKEFREELGGSDLKKEDIVKILDSAISKLSEIKESIVRINGNKPIGP